MKVKVGERAVEGIVKWRKGGNGERLLKVEKYDDKKGILIYYDVETDAKPRSVLLPE